MNKIGFDMDGIGHLIGDTNLKVPSFQRPYSWEKDEVMALLSDFMEDFPNEYFLGTIVAKKDGERLDIIDGQQRIATLSILFAALRDFLKAINDHQFANKIEEKYLSILNLRSREKEPKLELGNNDNEFYKEYIINGNRGSEIEDRKNSNARIVEAYKSCYSFINTEYEKSHKSVERLVDIVDYLNTNLKIIIVSVSDDSNAFTIFETLNDRGIDLSQTDLIKNYLFHKSNKRIDEAQDKWAKVTGAIEAAAEESEILQFVRYQWASKNGLTREKELFKSIKKSVNSQNLTLTYLTELESEVQNYLALLNDNHSTWKAYSPSTKFFIKTFLELQLIQNRPLLLSILRHFEKRDLENAVKLIVSWSIRNLITHSIGAGTLEKEFSNQARLISNSKVTTSKKFKESISNLIPNDTDFKEQFKLATVSKSHIARYYLGELEKSYHTTKESEPSKNTDNLNLEHILPEKPDLKKDWNSFTEEQHIAYYRRLGNMTLLDTLMNNSQKNFSFKKKKDVFKNSEIIITKSLKTFSDWNKESIEKRQSEFADQALKIWGLKA